ncbi:MAG: type II secretion system F family protein [Proteobacteria bacterium]|nr:type II secretion system F family protein [Pseudomonadota bacterium]MCP4921655.1 type II secretion system F family protein [Pseudomonadota bacterium]
MSTALKEQIKDQLEHKPEDQKESKRGFSLKRRASKDTQANFYRSFAILIRSGYPLPRALQMLGNSTSHPDLAACIRQIGMAVDGGSPMSKAMARFPWYFDAVTCSVIEAAEEAARLSEALEFLADATEMELTVREQATSAIAYPAVVSAMGGAVLMGMLYFVVPQFQGVMTEAGVEVTGVAGWIYALSTFVQNPIVPIFMAATVVAGFIGAWKWRSSNPVSFYRAIGAVPVFGGIMEKASLARFTSMFNMLTTSGISIPRALELASGTVDHAKVKRVVAQMKANVEEGKTMSEAIKGQGLPTNFTDMMALAEETGKLDEILPNLSKALTAELSRSAGRVSLVAEPAMLVIVGVMVLGIMLAFFLPYFQAIAGMSVAG